MGDRKWELETGNWKLNQRSVGIYQFEPKNKEQIAYQLSNQCYSNYLKFSHSLSLSISLDVSVGR